MEDSKKDWLNTKVTSLVESASMTYVYENVEVRKTGRKAERKLKSGKIDMVVEITPAEVDYGTWKKWVSEDVLFEVK